MGGRGRLYTALGLLGMFMALITWANKHRLALGGTVRTFPCNCTPCCHGGNADQCACAHEGHGRAPLVLDASGMAVRMRPFSEVPVNMYRAWHPIWSYLRG
jgi:hypothetical protein